MFTRGQTVVTIRRYRSSKSDKPPEGWCRIWIQMDDEVLGLDSKVLEKFHLRFLKVISKQMKNIKYIVIPPVHI